MLKSHATGWASNSPTPAQFSEFFRQIGSGRITKSSLQLFLGSKEEPSESPMYMVSAYFENSKKPNTNIVTSDDLNKLVTATLQLHSNPGINPYSKKRAERVIKITLRSLKSEGPFWWSTPGLKNTLLSRGAIIYKWDANERVIWERDKI